MHIYICIYISNKWIVLNISILFFLPITSKVFFTTLQWRHNELDGVSNHQPHDCLLNHLFRRRSKKTSKLRVTGLCVENSPVTSEFPAQVASNAENFSIGWRHHEAHNTQRSQGGNEEGDSSLAEPKWLASQLPLTDVFSLNVPLVVPPEFLGVWTSMTVDGIVVSSRANQNKPVIAMLMYKKVLCVREHQYICAWVRHVFEMLLTAIPF